uniref:Rhodanese domain-containing protein n=1 Tax=Lotharella globosa TaxID=91324 RepID=A0A6V3KKX3_9EUKA
MVRVYVIASFTTTKRQQKQRHSNTPCGGAQIEKQVGKTEENKSNTEANKETKQKKDKEEPGPRFSEDTVFIDVRGYEEAERDGTLPNSLTAQCDNSHDVKECVDKGLTKGAVPQDPKTAPPLVVYCRSGKRAQRFADELKRRGYKNITVGSVKSLAPVVGKESPKASQAKK